MADRNHAAIQRRARPIAHECRSLEPLKVEVAAHGGSTIDNYIQNE